MKYKLSPYLDIYKFPVTAITSIGNRITGLTITGLFISTGYCSLINVDPIEQYNKLNYLNKQIFNLIIIFPSTYHTYGGIRHFIWDKYPYLLKNTKVTCSSYFLLGLSISTTIMINNYITNINKNLTGK